ncbi:MAG: hypothetical protein ACR2LR_29125 [Hassallia sp.]
MSLSCSLTFAYRSTAPFSVFGETFWFTNFDCCDEELHQEFVADANIPLLQENADFINYHACDLFNRTKLLLTQV